MSNSCPTQLIPDTPAEADSFGGHSRVANAILELIQEESGGRAIGLEGHWGSGKSTVLNFVRHSIKNDRDWIFIPFDAWAHEGDPLRRSFLERLTNTLMDREWIDREKWSKRLDCLARRRRTTTINRTPHLKPLGGAAVLSLLTLTPIGIALVNSALDEPITLLSGRPVLPLWIGILFILLPALLIGINYLISAPDKDEVTDSDSDDSSSKRSWMSDLGLLWFRQIESERSETTEDPQPTSVEFEGFFDSVLEDAVTANRDRRVVLALDNLDRVAPHAALSILATLQTFLQRPHDRPDWFERVWLLIAYDHDALSSLWQSTFDVSGSQIDRDEIRKTAPRTVNNGDARVGKSYINKMFDVRLQVPPVVMSGWRDFLSRQLERAMPKHAHDVVPIRELYASHFSSPSPRDLVTFTNAVGAVHRQWGDTIPLLHQAYMVILRAQLEEDDVRARIIKRALPEHGVKSLLGNQSDLLDDLAALFFNVDVEEARQLLLAEPLEEAMRRSDTDRIGEFSEWPGFAGVLLKMPLHDWTADALTSALKGLAPLLDDRADWTEPLLARVRSAVMSFEKWRSFNKDHAAGLAVLLTHSPSTDVAETLLTALSRPPGDEDEPNIPSSDIDDWVDGVCLLFEVLDGLSMSKAYSRGVEIPTDAAGFIRAMSRLSLEDATLRAPHFKLTDATAITDELKTQIDGGPSEEVRRAIDAMQHVELNLDWSSVIQALKSALETDADLDTTHLDSGLRTLWDLRDRNPEAAEALTTLANGGYLLHHLVALSPDIPTAALCAVTHLHELPAMPNPPSVGRSQEGHTKLIRMLDDPINNEPALNGMMTLPIRELGLGDLVFEASEKRPASRPWTLATLDRIADDGTLIETLGINSVVHHWSDILAAAGEGVFKRLVGEPQGAALYDEVVADPFEIERAPLYRELAETDDPPDAYIQWCVKGLQALDEDGWYGELTQSADSAALALTLHLLNTTHLTLPNAFRDALVRHADDLMIGETDSDELAERWSDLARALDEDKQGILAHELCQHMDGRAGQIAGAFFDVWGMFLTHSLPTPKDDDTLKRTLVSLVKAQNPRGLRWVNEFFIANQTVSQSWKRTKKDPWVKELKDRVADALRGDDIDAQLEETLSAVAEKLGVAQDSSNGP